jgi:hypothetical protein
MRGIEQHIDWAAPAMAANGRAGRDLTTAGSRKKPPDARRDVMDTLLGKNNLVAIDVSGGDPYNATGRFFRR